MIDLTLSGLLDFSATSVVASYNSQTGRDFFESHFGSGAVEVTLPKTGGSDLESVARENGLRVSII